MAQQQEMNDGPKLIDANHFKISPDTADRLIGLAISGDVYPKTVWAVATPMENCDGFDRFSIETDRIFAIICRDYSRILMGTKCIHARILQKNRPGYNKMDEYHCGVNKEEWDKAERAIERAMIEINTGAATGSTGRKTRSL